MKEWFLEIFAGKAAAVTYMLLLPFAYVAALLAGIFIPAGTGYGFFSIPIAAAVLAAGPTYCKAFKWSLNRAMES